MVTQFDATGPSKTREVEIEGRRFILRAMSLNAYGSGGYCASVHYHFPHPQPKFLNGEPIDFPEFLGPIYREQYATQLCASTVQDCFQLGISFLQGRLAQWDALPDAEDVIDSAL